MEPNEIELANIKRRIHELVLRLEEQGALGAQFKRVLELQENAALNFSSEVVELFLDNTRKNLANVQGHLAVDAPSFDQISQLLILMRGSNETFGAAALTEQCVRFQAACHAHNVSGCREILAEQWQALDTLQEELKEFLRLDAKRQQIVREKQGPPPPT